MFIQQPEGITFTVSGALDYTEDIIIQIKAIDPGDASFTEINPLDLLWNHLNFDHLSSVINVEFFRLIKRIPHRSDKDTFIKMWYKCSWYYQHSHNYLKGPTVKNLTIIEAIEYIKHNKMDIVPKSFIYNDTL